MDGTQCAYHEPMQETLRTRCVCGWEVTGSEDEVVEATLDHGQRVHNMAGTREQVLERAERIAPDPPVATPEPAGANAPANGAQVTVVDVPERRRFEALLDGQTVGFTQYTLAGDRITLVHTEVDPDLEGHGIGSRLAQLVLADVRARGLAVAVSCPFISAYVRRHRADYPDVEVAQDRTRSATG